MESFLNYLIHQLIDNPILSSIALGVLTFLYLKIKSHHFSVKKGTIYRTLKYIIIKQLRIFLGDDWIKIDKQLRGILLVIPTILVGLLSLPFTNTNFVRISFYYWFFMVLSGPGIKPKLNNWEIIKNSFIEYKLSVFLYACSALCFIWSSGYFHSFLLCLLIAMIVIGSARCLLAILPRVTIRILRPFVNLLYRDKDFRKAVFTASIGGLVFIL